MKNFYLFLLLFLGLSIAPAQAQLSGSDSLQARLSSIFTLMAPSLSLAKVY